MRGRTRAIAEEQRALDRVSFESSFPHVEFTGFEIKIIMPDAVTLARGAWPGTGQGWSPAVRMRG